MPQQTKIDLEDIRLIENYRGYKRVWCYTPTQSAPHIHLGYLDSDFFSYLLPPYSKHIDISTPTSVVDYYIDMIFLKNSGLEHNWISMNEEYKPYLDALNSAIAMRERS